MPPFSEKQLQTVRTEGAVRMLTGGLICVLGLFLSFASFHNASVDSGTYVVAWVSIAVGAALFFHGLGIRATAKQWQHFERHSDFTGRGDSTNAPQERQQLPQDLDAFASAPKPDQTGIVIVGFLPAFGLAVYLLFLR